MKQKVFVLFGFLLISSFGFGQNNKYYKENGGEFIFSFADIEQYGNSLNTPVRFTMFFHVNRLYHYNFNSFSGIYSGFSLKNIGFITKENDIKTKRRTYSAGIPLALKIGNLDKGYFVYGGASYELFFHFKQKQFIDGNKSKYSEWFSSRTDRFAPSFFGGIQFPGGFNLKFKYYPENFLNEDFTGTDFGREVDYSSFNKVKLFYIGLSYYIQPEKILDGLKSKSEQAKYAILTN